ncbi:MAG: hypothetical protein KJ709_06300 [Nanoarchaeota archaeon]|nr:hypothetical protein [Nanoarchaeota archaeon]
MATTQSRLVAVKLDISSVLSSDYREEEGWEPNYLLLGDATKVSRINVIGMVVDRAENACTLDDGTGLLPLRFFEKGLDIPAVGTPVLVIGRPREFNGERFLASEIMKPLASTKWVELRRLELKGRTKTDKKEAAEEGIGNAETLLKLIKDMDKGDGVDSQELVKAAGMSDADSILESLLRDGEIFEVKPGRVKLLG